MIPNPGPGAYTSDSFNTKPAKNYSFAKTKRSSILENAKPDRHMRETSPGPNMYFMPGGIGDVPKYALPKDKREKAD